MTQLQMTNEEFDTHYDVPKKGDEVTFYDYDENQYITGKVAEIFEGYWDGDECGERYYPTTLMVQHSRGTSSYKPSVDKQN